MLRFARTFKEVAQQRCLDAEQNPTDVTKLREVDTDFYFVAGTLEERFSETTKTLAE